MADVLPLLAFFILYRVQGIYAATLGAIVLSIVTAGYKYKTQGKLEPLPLLGVVLMVVLGGLTVYLKDPRFLLWKPTLAYLATSVFFAMSCRANRTPLAERVFHGSLRLSPRLWRQATWAYASFFAFMATLNLVVAYAVSLDTWVKFKVFGTIVLSAGFMIAHALYYSARQLPDVAADQQTSLNPDLSLTASEP